VAPRPIDPEARRIGLIMRSIREQQGLTQVEVAVELGKKEGAYAAYEAGRSRFTLPELPLVARALKVPVAHLATRLGFCGGGGSEGVDIATALVTRFGPQLGQSLVRLDRILAQMEHGDTAALAVTLRRYVEPYESRQQ
jgi:transcriptional regulator with XRE-family HTH domain